MAIEEVTDNALFGLYQKRPEVRELVDRIQKKHRTHFSQKDQPDYNSANAPLANKEAKEAVKMLLAQQEQGIQEKVGSTSTASHTGRLKYAVGLIAVLASVAAFASGIPYSPPIMY